MDLIRFLGAFVVLVVAVSAVGALFTVGGNGLLTGPYTVAAVITGVIVVAGILGSVGLGVRSSRFLSNPYW